MESLNHKAIAVPIKLEPHPNADTLSIIRIWDTVPYVAKTEYWKNETVGIFIPSDNLVDTNREEFESLRKEGKPLGWTRVKNMKIRGIMSLGILIKAPGGTVLDQDFTDVLNVKPYIKEDAETRVSTRGIIKPKGEAPSGVYYKYDVENYYKYHKLFESDEPVVVTEKLHGSNMRLTYNNDRIYVGSRQFWYDEDKKALFWKAYRQNPQLETALKCLSGHCLYGEAIGEQKNFKYDCIPNEYKFKCFDILKPDGTWMNWKELKETCISLEIPMVPIIDDNFPYNVDRIVELSQGKTLLGNHVREGVCVRPKTERWDDKCGRVHLKFVDPNF